MPCFPDNFRDIDGWSTYGINLSTQSNEAAKLYDAALSQQVYFYNHNQLGGVARTIQKMLAIDPDFYMANIMKLSMENYVTSPIKESVARKRLISFCSKTDESKLTENEKEHLKAVKFLAVEDLIGAMETYYQISKSHPHDMLAIHLGYLLGLVTGQVHYMRDIPASVVEHYKPHMPYYGHIHGKLCFGQAETGDYVKAKKSGRRALEVLACDSWAHHSMVHVFENMSQPKEGLYFIEETESGWMKGTNFSQHIKWHAALNYIHLKDYETALTLYDEFVGRVALRDGGTFPLTDAISLLMRLNLEGVDIGDRMVKPAKMWAKHDDEFTNLFCDAHSCLSKMLAGERGEAEKLIEGLKEYINDDRMGHNKDITMKYGVNLLEGLKLFCEGDYGRSVDRMKLSIPQCLKGKMYGSKAQRDIFNLIFVQAGIQSGTLEHLNLAKDVLDGILVENKIKTLAPLHQRLYDKVMFLHEKLEKN